VLRTWTERLSFETEENLLIKRKPSCEKKKRSKKRKKQRKKTKMEKNIVGRMSWKKLDRALDALDCSVDFQTFPVPGHKWSSGSLKYAEVVEIQTCIER